MIYESANSLQSDLLKIETGTDFQFPPHLHTSFEWITVTEGEMCVTVDGCAYPLRRGEAIFIFPNQVHALSTETHSRHFLCIFSPKLVRAYGDIANGKVPLSALYAPSEETARKMLSLTPGGVSASVFTIKGLLYTLCGEFDSVAQYTDRQREREDLLERIFSFVRENYSGACTLTALSARLGYHYVYLSRYFKERTGLSFTAYVNRYRINEATYLLKNSGGSILQVAYDCGFDSLRSFNRNFKSGMGMTPMEYRGKQL